MEYSLLQKACVHKEMALVLCRGDQAGPGQRWRQRADWFGWKTMGRCQGLGLGKWPPLCKSTLADTRLWLTTLSTVSSTLWHCRQGTAAGRDLVFLWRSHRLQHCFHSKPGRNGGAWSSTSSFLKKSWSSEIVQRQAVQQQCSQITQGPPPHQGLQSQVIVFPLYTTYCSICFCYFLFEI